MIELKLKNRKGNFHVNSKEVKDILDARQDIGYLQDISNKFMPFSLKYPLGTDNLGRCVMSRLMYGIRPTIFLSLLKNPAQEIVVNIRNIIIALYTYDCFVLIP